MNRSATWIPACGARSTWLILTRAKQRRWPRAFLQVQDIGPRLRKLLWKRTNGRPLFIESLLRVLQQDEQIHRTDGQAELAAHTDTDALPEDVRQLIVSQIDRLSPDARTCYRRRRSWAMVSPPLLVALAEAVNEIRLEILLGEMIYSQIIELLPDLTYRFLHGLAQTTVYESLNRLQRQKLHHAAAEYLMKQTDRPVIRIAYHLASGGLRCAGSNWCRKPPKPPNRITRSTAPSSFIRTPAKFFPMMRVCAYSWSVSSRSAAREHTAPRTT